MVKMGVTMVFHENQGETRGYPIHRIAQRVASMAELITVIRKKKNDADTLEVM